MQYRYIIGLVMINRVALFIINATVKNYGTFSLEKVQARIESQWVLMMSDEKPSDIPMMHRLNH